MSRSRTTSAITGPSEFQAMAKLRERRRLMPTSLLTLSIKWSFRQLQPEPIHQELTGPRISTALDSLATAVPIQISLETFSLRVAAHIITLQLTARTLACGIGLA